MVYVSPKKLETHKKMTKKLELVMTAIIEILFFFADFSSRGKETTKNLAVDNFIHNCG